MNSEPTETPRKHANIYTVGSIPTACIIIRLDDSNYLVDATLEDGYYDGHGAHLVGKMPTLWGMIRLWWLHRNRRKGQTEAEAAICVHPPKLAEAPAKAKKRP